eukprot:11526594-Alexandrium_andersonii.AAC.1
MACKETTRNRSELRGHTARNCSNLLGTALRGSELFETAASCSELLEAARDGVKRSSALALAELKVLKTARSCSNILEALLCGCCFAQGAGPPSLRPPPPLAEMRSHLQ